MFKNCSKTFKIVNIYKCNIKTGHTALMIACNYGCIDIVKLLLNYGLDITILIFAFYMAF